SALPLGYGAAKRQVRFDPVVDRAFQPSQRDGTSNLTTQWRSRKPTSGQAVTARTVPAECRQHKRTKQMRRTAHESRKSNRHHENQQDRSDGLAQEDD